MADETPDVAAPAAAADQPQPKLMLHSQFLQDMSFENPAGAKSFSKADMKPQVQVNLNVDSRKLGETLYEVALKITANAKQDDEPCFLTEIDYRGVFSLTGVDEKVAPQVLLIEGPRTIFPFARRIIADAVRDGGFPPLMLEPVDFVNLYRQHAVRRTAEGEEAAAPADA
ncbi:MAG: protein-export chaperone SecB [Alphaproteobacteria bacterium]|nr:protein-export chaperone SecB [Rhodospirillaceae bacterium]MDG2480386.1 protein-export chaperone SecB [Alphaproteobacteria bacterium]MBT6205966.1 protein-export chaperone SecB [Rhodospirillaceae bacterium]MBT6511013.1 protein-export chaperone SecB [Rhodospirillaceae bacterium]MBT7615606.1 protein-export chaperone SecB [Rhodospirillaceae bacterium]